MLGMRNSTGSQLFSDFKSDHSRVVCFRPLVKGNEDSGNEIGKWYITIGNEAKFRRRLSLEYT